MIIFTFSQNDFMVQPRQLNSLELDFLKLMAQKTLSEMELSDIKLLVARYFLNKADAEMEEIWKKKNLSEEEINKILQA